MTKTRTDYITKISQKNDMSHQSKYIDNLKKQREIREVEQNSAWERMEQLKVQKEIGEAPVEKFITSAYKKQMEVQ